MTTNTQPSQTLTQAQTISNAIQPFIENLTSIVETSRQYGLYTRYYSGYLDGLYLALEICKEVDKQHANA